MNYAYDEAKSPVPGNSFYTCFTVQSNISYTESTNTEIE